MLAGRIRQTVEASHAKKASGRRPLQGWHLLLPALHKVEGYAADVSLGQGFLALLAYPWPTSVRNGVRFARQGTIAQTR